MAPWADVLYACDAKWWKEYHDQAHDKSSGEFWTINQGAAKEFNLNVIDYHSGGGVCRSQKAIKAGGNSGFQAVSLALLFGAEKIVLLGYDMQFSGNRKHWHRDHSERLGNPVHRKFPEWIKGFEQLKKESRASFVNCTRETALTCFERAELSDVLQGENHESMVSNT